jgi:hypothetical protein
LWIQSHDFGHTAISGGQFAEDQVAPAIAAKDAFRAHLANEVKAAVVVVDTDHLWQDEWGVLYVRIKLGGIASLRVLLMVGVMLVPCAEAVEPAKGGKAEPASKNGGQTLTCEFKAIQTGQFQGLGYITGEADGTISLTLVASAADAKAGRAVMMIEDRAAVATMVLQPGQTLFIDSGTANDASVVSLFTGAGQQTGIPAAYSRQQMLGPIPIVSQYAGMCRVL